MLRKDRYERSLFNDGCSGPSRSELGLNSSSSSHSASHAPSPAPSARVAHSACERSPRRARLRPRHGATLNPAPGWAPPEEGGRGLRRRSAAGAPRLEGRSTSCTRASYRRCPLFFFLSQTKNRTVNGSSASAGPGPGAQSAQGLPR